jgi:uncharacterized protein (TIGR02145 family)
MMKKLLKFVFLNILVLIGAITSCHRDKPIKPYNPTNGLTTSVCNQNKTYGTAYDIDGNEYKTIVIGTQTWMAENLRTTHYQNGDSIPNIIDTAQWARLESGAYCNYNNTESLDTIATYGRLYNWYATADSRKLALKGWHVPTAIEWNTLFAYLGGDAVAADKLKEVGNTHWADPFKSDNSSGFTALPGGWRSYPRTSEKIGIYGSWWTSTEFNENFSAFLYLEFFASNVFKDFNYKRNGYSIRCIKD